MKLFKVTGKMKNTLSYKEYIGTVSFSAEDRLFYGKVEGIDDLITFEGSTVEELDAAFRYMVDQHIADCEKEGKLAEKSYKGVFNVRISSTLHKKASHAAIKKGITLNQLIKQALERELDEE